MNRLPNQYVVKCDTSEQSTEVASFIKGRLFQGYNRYVIKHDGLLDTNHTDCNVWDEIPINVKHLPIYIYSQWLILKDSKEYVLPENWYIKCTKTNRSILNKWRKEKAGIQWHLNKYFVEGDFLVSKNLTDSSFYYGGTNLSFRYAEYVEITLAQFKQYVLKQSTQKSEIKQDKMKDKIRVINYSHAQKIINIACGDWKPKLAKIWGERIVLNENINIEESFYQEMRKACSNYQNEVFDEIFGKDILFKEGDWVITTTTIREGNNKYKKGEVFKILMLVDDRAYFDKNNSVEVNRLALATDLDRVKYAKKQMIDLANSFDLVPSKISF